MMEEIERLLVEFEATLHDFKKYGKHPANTRITLKGIASFDYNDEIKKIDSQEAIRKKSKKELDPIFKKQGKKYLKIKHIETKEAVFEAFRENIGGERYDNYSPSEREIMLFLTRNMNWIEGTKNMRKEGIKESRKCIKSLVEKSILVRQNIGGRIIFCIHPRFIIEQVYE